MKRATEDHVVKAKEGVNLEGARLTSFLLNVQEYEAAAAKLVAGCENTASSNCSPKRPREKTDSRTRKLWKNF